MVTPLVSERNRRLLHEDGWRVLSVPVIQNPFFYDIKIEEEDYNNDHREAWWQRWIDSSGLGFSLLTQTAQVLRKLNYNMI